MLVIGFGHRARQGKNTAALAFMEAAPIAADIKLCAFADALKAEVRHACIQTGGAGLLIEGFKEAGLMPDWVHDEIGKPRTLLQWWGTDYRRKKDPDYWVKRLQKSIADRDPHIVLVTDVRFMNEVDFIHSLNGYVIKVIKDGPPDIDVHPHASEAILDGFTGWDYTLQAATLPELKQKGHALYLEIEKAHGQKQ